jgi:hypothetical protein
MSHQSLRRAELSAESRAQRKARLERQAVFVRAFHLHEADLVLEVVVAGAKIFLIEIFHFISGQGNLRNCIVTVFIAPSGQTKTTVLWKLWADALSQMRNVGHSGIIACPSLLIKIEVLLSSMER